MADQRLRDLFYRWQATKADDDGASWILARLRADDLEQSKFELLVHLGFTPATKTGIAVPRINLEGLELVAKLSALGGPESIMRVQMACFAHFIPLQRELGNWGREEDVLLANIFLQRADQEKLHELIREANRRLASLTPDEEPCTLYDDPLRNFIHEMTYPPPGVKESFHDYFLYWSLAGLAPSDPDFLTERRLFGVLKELFDNLKGGVQPSDETLCFSIMRETLIPWALGTGDPLTDRMQALTSS